MNVEYTFISSSSSVVERTNIAIYLLKKRFLYTPIISPSDKQSKNRSNLYISILFAILVLILCHLYPPIF